jgi:hypothetical protein
MDKLLCFVYNYKRYFFLFTFYLQNILFLVAHFLMRCVIILNVRNKWRKLIWILKTLQKIWTGLVGW